MPFPTSCIVSRAHRGRARADPRCGLSSLPRGRADARAVPSPDVDVWSPGA